MSRRSVAMITFAAALALGLLWADGSASHGAEEQPGLAQEPLATRDPDRPTERSLPAQQPVVGETSLILPAAYRGHRWHEPAFGLSIRPGHVQSTIPNQRCVFLVTVRSTNAAVSAGEPVQLTCDAPGAVVSVEPSAIGPDDVAEVTVIPNSSSVGSMLELTVTGERSGSVERSRASFEVFPGWADPNGELAQHAAGVRDEFVPWLAEHHPELGITESTEWRSVVTRPRILVVMYHLFFSEDWEMGVRWHVMIPPHDWTEIYLRHRWDEDIPSYEFKIRSRSGGDEPVPVTPEEEVWR